MLIFHFLYKIILTLSNSKYEFKTCDEWILYLKEKLFSLSNYKIEFIVDNKMPDKCPIIIGKRKKLNLKCIKKHDKIHK